MPTLTELRRARKLLGVQEEATKEEIHESYIKFMKRHHPDLHFGDHEKQKLAIIGIECFELLTGKRQKSSCLGLTNPKIQENIEAAEKDKRQYRNGIYNY